MFRIAEIFDSIKGEGPKTGIPMTFVRFAGCNLSCKFCDTNHMEKMQVTEDDLIDTLRHMRPTWVVLTGGEPLLQVTCSLVERINALGAVIHLETNGTLYTSAVHAMKHVTISPKEQYRGDVANYVVAREWCTEPAAVDEVRYTVLHRNWDLPGGSLLPVRSPIHSFSPVALKYGDGVAGTNPDIINRAIALAFKHRRHGGRLNMQLHKLIGVK